MLSLFPELLDFGFFAPFILRVFMGLYLCIAGYSIAKSGVPSDNTRERMAFLLMGVIVAMTGILFLVGLWVQLMGLISFSLGTLGLYFKYHRHHLMHESYAFYVLFSLVSLALVILGPGPYSVDLPL